MGQEVVRTRSIIGQELVNSESDIGQQYCNSGQHMVKGECVCIALNVKSCSILDNIQV